MSHETGAHLGNAPLLPLPRLEGVEGVFLRCRRTLSWESDVTSPNSTTRPARARSVQWSYPSGAGVQAKAMRWAPARSSSLRYRLAWGRSRSTPFSPTSAKRRLMRYTLDSATSRTWATLGADQLSLVLSRMRARVATLAGLLPARTKCSSRSRSSGVSLTANLSRTIPPPHNNSIRHQHSIRTRNPESHPKSNLTEY